MYNQEENPKANIEVDDLAKSYLLETAKWGSFVSIVGFVFLGLFFVIALCFLVFGPDYSYSSYGYDGHFSFKSFGFIYLVIAALGFYPVYAIYQFSRHVKTALKLSDKDQFNTGLSHLKGAFKYYGIILIIELAFIALFVFIGIIVGIVVAVSHH